jgi:nucleotide-binding universal stress UspA family protein
MYRSIVVGTDGSETAAEAVRKAADLAKATGGTVHVVSAYEPSAVKLAGGGGAEGSEFGVSPRSEVDALLEQAAGIIRAQGASAECYARRGDPAEVIIDVAEEQNADAIVVGNKGMQSARRFLLGSVPDKIAHHAPCSVLIVKTT